MAESARTITARSESKRTVVRREDLIKLFSLSQLLTEVGKRLEVMEDKNDFEASPAIISKLVELRNLPEE